MGFGGVKQVCNKFPPDLLRVLKNAPTILSKLDWKLDRCRNGWPVDRMGGLAIVRTTSFYEQFSSSTFARKIGGRSGANANVLTVGGTTEMRRTRIAIRRFPPPWSVEDSLKRA